MSVIGAAINVSLVIAFLTINVTQDRVYIYFVFAGLWGMADAVWQTQINGKSPVPTCLNP